MAPGATVTTAHCVMANVVGVWPVSPSLAVTVMLAVRNSPVAFAATVNPTVMGPTPLPLDELGAVTVTHGSFDATVHRSHTPPPPDPESMKSNVPVEPEGSKCAPTLVKTGGAHWAIAVPAPGPASSSVLPATTKNQDQTHRK